MWQLGQQLLTAAWKIDDLVRDEIFNLLERLQIYNSFSKSKKLVFSMHGAWHCPNTAPIMVHGQALRIITWQHPSRGHPLFVSWMCWTILLGWALWTVISTQQRYNDQTLYNCSLSHISVSSHINAGISKRLKQMRQSYKN
jgi:hypothetical protein